MRLLPKLKSSICQYYGITWSQFEGGSRQHRVCEARGLFCYLARALYPEIRFVDIRRFVKRDHSTVVHGINRVQGYLDESDRVMLTAMEAVLTEIGVYNRESGLKLPFEIENESKTDVEALNH